MDLATAYIADQKYEGTIPLKEALSKGSIFPNLYIQYANEVKPITVDNDRKSQIRNIQALNLLCLDLNLYLINHPNCAKALEDFMKYNQALDRETNRFERMYGPITFTSLNNDKYPYKWIDGPWPWEKGN